MYRYFLGFAKIAADVFALPDVYTYMLARGQYKYYFFLLPFSLFSDILLNFPIGTMFIIDGLSLLIWKRLCQWTHFADHAITLYCVRYFGLYMIGLAPRHIISQILYCFFFAIMFRIIRGARRNSNW